MTAESAGAQRMVRRGTAPDTKAGFERRLESGLSRQPKQEESGPVEFLNSGSIVLNLAASQRALMGGWARGRIVNLVGDGSSGKTLCALEACAHAFYGIKERKTALYKQPKTVSVVYNNAEGVMDFPVAKMYGQEFVDGVEWEQSPSLESFGRDYVRRVQALKDGHALIYVVDSLDSLQPEEAIKRVEKSIKDDKPLDGSYGTEKAKFLSNSFFNKLCSDMHEKDATLIIISQIREKLGVMFGKKHYRAGGKSLDFYTHQVAWLYEKRKLDKTFRGQKRVYGIETRVRMERNKTAMPFREADIKILFDYGIDDVGSMTDMMFGSTGDRIEWDGETMKREDFINMIDGSKSDYERLVRMVELDWRKIEAAVKTARRSKF